jgi:hypothetical protein
VDNVVHVRAEKITQLPDGDIRAISHDYHHFNSAYLTDAAKKHPAEALGPPSSDLYLDSGYLIQPGKRSTQLTLDELMESHDFH